MLTLLIEDYEEKNYPLPQVSPNESMHALMEQRGLKHKDIWPGLGNKGAATEVLSGRRSISKTQAKDWLNSFMCRSPCSCRTAACRRRRRVGALDFSCLGNLF